MFILASSVIDGSDFDEPTNDLLDLFDDNSIDISEINNENLNLIEQDIIDEEHFSQLVYDNWCVGCEFDANPTEYQRLIVNLVKKCRVIARITKKSSIIAQFIRKEQEVLRLNRDIRIDCRSRWNSTYLLIGSLIYLKHIIIKLFTDKRTLGLRSDQVQKLTTIELNSDSWDFLSSLWTALDPFFRATVFMSGRQYPSIGLAYCAIQKAKNFCQSTRKTNDQTKKLKKLLLDKLNKYFYSDVNQFQQLQVRI